MREIFGFIHDYIYALKLWWEQAGESPLILFGFLLMFFSFGCWLILKLIRWILWTGFLLVAGYMVVMHFGGPETLSAEFWRVVGRTN